MILTGVARLGRDVEVRYTQSGKEVANLSLAYNYGQKGQDGYKPSQWVEAALWGKQAESLAPYLTKGAVVNVTLRDVHIEEYEGKNGTGHKLVGTVIDIEFAGGAKREEQEPVRKPAPKPKAQDLDDEDIPF